jgi:hypothetical protein
MIGLLSDIRLDVFQTVWSAAVYFHNPGCHYAYLTAVVQFMISLGH